MWSGKFNLKEKSSRKEKRKVAHKEKKEEVSRKHATLERQKAFLNPIVNMF